jgi:putative OPT family oligopeptide transporter
MIHGPPVDAAGNILSGYDAAFHVWTTKIRYMGVGAMVVGGIWSLVEIAGRLRAGLQRTMKLRHALDDRGSGDVPRTERDTPNRVIVVGSMILFVPLVLVFRSVIDPVALGVSADTYRVLVVVAALLAMLGGFLFSAVAGYITGLVGSSNNPVSGVTIATILVSSLLLSLLVGPEASTAGAAATAILIGSVVCCAAAISGDNLQDLKAGQLVGATPVRQQFMQVVGVVAGALTLGPVLNLLYSAYGLGDRLPRPGMDASDALAAPQATLMQSVAEGVFAGSLEWGMIGIGAVVAAGVIGIDRALKSSGSSFRAPVLAVAVGIYLPVELSVTMFAGGVVAHLASRGAAAGGETQNSRGLLFASGLIAGEALAGIALAIPFAAAQNTNALSIAGEGFAGIANALGVLVTLAVAGWMVVVGAGKRSEG